MMLELVIFLILAEEGMRHNTETLIHMLARNEKQVEVSFSFRDAIDLAAV